MHNINVLEIAETWVNKSDKPEFFSLYARIGCSRQSHERWMSALPSCPTRIAELGNSANWVGLP